MVNEWTRDDLPDATELCRMSVYNIDVMVDRNLNAIVGHLNANHPKSDTDRWSRAHEIVEGERDQARRERDTWKDKWLDTYEALRQARTAPAVPLHQPDGTRMDASHLPIGADDDPAVFVVRESDVAAVEVTRDFGGWCADGAWVAGVDDTAEWVRGRAAEMVVYAARSEAVARAIEAGQAADPLLEKAQEFAALADWELTDREAELLHTVAAHVLGQEAGDEPS